ncbi:U-box domain-containing protein [Trichoderma reesei RUT C-30]|uniref:U-box domain-containing protein n=1 Tax=Hypocrea jecorina (strain ATCC 56765 / BCRC 32924 / NRRL 11460 / Rut C-30) TaxID=1344414 RepID=A0A024SAD2_HYPJR|nr:U-box domain-containing protein [Trichoderma reesei RUT C-30]
MTNLNKHHQPTDVPLVHAQLEQLSIAENKPKQAAGDPPPYDAHSGPVDLQLHHIPSKEALLVKIQPPKEPAKPISHVACDIVLVIDVSGSMCAAAPVPGEGGEETGLSVLDLTKHAAFTIIETMDERDRLGIVTFETESKVVQCLEPMTDTNKEQARARIKALRPLGSTNLWHGMLDAIKLFTKELSRSHRVPAMMVLTDGEPNHMCPPQGYIPKLRAMPPLPATIHTFGFGYTLRSGLLKSIAEFSGGNYAFIPDAGMIGTVFVHAVANLQSTFATNASLTLSYASPVKVEQTTGDAVNQQAPVEFGYRQRKLTISLGNIQYGQSRDLWLRLRGATQEKQASDSVLLEATLAFEEAGRSSSSSSSLVSARLGGSDALDAETLSPAEMAYQESRALILSFISTLFPLASDGEYKSLTLANQQIKKREELSQLIETLPSGDFADNLNKSLLEDLCGEHPKGQISLALSTPHFFTKWGRHYLPSYANALSRQICNSFKDSAPLQFGSESPLFIACRDRLDTAFDSIPAPEPSRVVLSSSSSRRRRQSSGGGTTSHTTTTTTTQPSSMARYRNSSGVCFAGSTAVELASGRVTEIRRLRHGTRVRTPLGSKKVAMVLKTKVSNETLCRIGSVLVTPWHPLSTDGKGWDFPASMSDDAVLYTGSIYSVLLQPDRRPDAHAIRVGDAWGVTLGHGIMRGDDARAHGFFGDYRRVKSGLMKLDSAGRKGVVQGRGIERDAMTGLGGGGGQHRHLVTDALLHGSELTTK